LQTARQALELIEQTANEICQSVPPEQTSQGVTLSGDARAKLGGLLGKLTDLGIAGAANYNTNSSVGVYKRTSNRLFRIPMIANLMCSTGLRRIFSDPQRA